MNDQEISEAQFDEAFGAKPTAALVDEADGPSRDEADFRRVGLDPDVARKAAQSLKSGAYGSFEEAAIMSSPLTPPSGSNLRGRVNRQILETVVRERKIRRHRRGEA